MTKSEQIDQVVEMFKSGLISQSDARASIDLISRIDVPAAAPPAADRCKAPEGYAPCAKKCGRWKHRTNNYCWTCATVEYKYVPAPALVAETPDWTPPLAAQPAETAHDECCEPGCSTSCPARKPAPQPAPACAHGCSDTQANTACPTHGKPAPAKPACERGANLHGGPVLLRCTGKGLFRKLCEHCYLAIEPLQKGPVGDVLHESDVPERLGRPKLAHSAMWADEAEDVR
jgi:hypothetical protein